MGGYSYQVILRRFGPDGLGYGEHLGFIHINSSMDDFSKAIQNQLGLNMDKYKPMPPEPYPYGDPNGPLLDFGFVEKQGRKYSGEPTTSLELYLCD